jgi:hypothetical protein
MDEKPEPMPDPELLRQYRELVTSDEHALSSTRGLARYLKRQPPQGEDAVKVGDLAIKMRESVREQLDPKSEDYEDYACRCSLHMMGVRPWYELAIMLDPSNPVPYERLAREIWWETGEMPGCTLEPLAHDGYDDATLRRVMEEYQKEDAEHRGLLQKVANAFIESNKTPGSS